ncbi:hypothetical protein [uncultured Friedmanniella sp.]|uniref:hypothetical protein n=1 Tax=uncultured Friedmanniella sp. TaxID=335381 RepID=UPI0035CB121E
MFLLELDPNIVKPGWTPFLITIGLAAVMYLLFRSMRRQFRRTAAHYGVLPQEQPPAVGAEGEPQPGRDAASAASPVEGSPPRR